MGESSPASGTARPTPGRSSASGPLVVVDGRCLEKTLQRVRGVSEEALDAVRQQSEELIGRVLEVYESEVAPGEVGHGGSARAGSQRVEGFGPTGLLYGRIQSGKTVAMITFTALAIDNGFRVVVVLTTNFTELVRQTKDRFDDLGRVLVTASTERSEWSNEGEVSHIREALGERGLVIVCAKHAGHLESVLNLLDAIDAANYPTIILDDEADQASPDANERKRSLADKPEDVEATKIHAAIRDIREYSRHHVFLQVTATPYALLLQRTDSPQRPKFTFLLEPGDGYTGGEDFFSRDHVLGPEGEVKPPLVFVPDSETQEIDSGSGQVPRGLENAIAYFLVAASAQALRDPGTLRIGQNFLCHTSHKKDEHTKFRDWITSFVAEFGRALDPLDGRVGMLVEWAYAELRKSLEDLPALDEIVEDIRDRLPRRKVRLVNSDGNSGSEVRGAPNFIVGGNIVGRGLTISNLLVTYYVRWPRVSQMDTMLQHARMFGYRRSLMEYTRVFLPRELAHRFLGIHEAERELRDLLPTTDALEQIPVQVVGNLKPTRYGVLDTGSTITIKSGKHLYPAFPLLGASKASIKRVERIAEEVWPGWSEGRDASAVVVSVEVVDRFLRELAPPEWDQSALRLILRSIGSGDLARAQYRPMDRGGAHDDVAPGQLSLSTGVLEGAVLKDARAQELPTFFLFRQITRREVWQNDRFFYPTIVFPTSMPTVIYNNTEVD